VDARAERARDGVEAPARRHRAIAGRVCGGADASASRASEGIGGRTRRRTTLSRDDLVVVVINEHCASSSSATRLTLASRRRRQTGERRVICDARRCQGGFCAVLV
jgi:hypothetical protein